MIYWPNSENLYSRPDSNGKYTQLYLCDDLDCMLAELYQLVTVTAVDNIRIHWHLSTDY